MKRTPRVAILSIGLLFLGPLSPRVAAASWCDQALWKLGSIVGLFQLLPSGLELGKSSPTATLSEPLRAAVKYVTESVHAAILEPVEASDPWLDRVRVREEAEKRFRQTLAEALTTLTPRDQIYLLGWLGMGAYPQLCASSNPLNVLNWYSEFAEIRNALSQWTENEWFYFVWHMKAALVMTLAEMGSHEALVEASLNVVFEDTVDMNSYVVQTSLRSALFKNRALAENALDEALGRLRTQSGRAFEIRRARGLLWTIQEELRRHS